MKRSAVVLALLLAWALGSRPAAGQSLQNALLRNSFDPVGAGARATGMGGAFIAVADDGTAASFNPAGLAQLRRSEVAFVSFSDGLKTTFERATGLDIGLPADSKARSNVPEFFGVAIPFEAGARHLTFQLSYQRVVDFRGEGLASVLSHGGHFDLAGFPSPFDLEYVIDLQSSQSGGLHAISASAGYELSDRLSLGASVNQWLGSWRAEGRETGKAKFVGSDWSQQIEDLRVTFTQEHSLQGLNVNGGFLLHYPKLSIGGVLRLPFGARYRLSEESQESALEETGQFGDPTTSHIDMKGRLRWPRSGGLGAALRPVRGLTLAADFSYAEWSRAVIENVPNGALHTEAIVDAEGQPLSYVFTDRNFFDLNPEAKTLTQDTTQWRFGAEYLLTPRRVVVPLRVGYFVEHSPVTDLGTLDSRRLTGVTFGFGLNFRRLAFDVAAERRSGTASIGLIYDESPSPGAGTFPTERFTISRVIASVILRFGRAGDDPLKRLLRAIFVGKKE